MKNIKEILSDTSPKNLKKLDKAFADRNAAAYKDAFIAEALRTTAVDFPAINCIVTDSYLCEYSHLVAMLGNSVTIVPLEKIRKVYRTNMNEKGEYSHDWFWLRVDTTDNARVLMSPVSKNTKGNMEIFQQIIACIGSRMSTQGMGGEN